MVIQWFGHSSFLIISANGTKIITDPYESGGFGGSLHYKPISVSADIVTVSHDHADHAYVEDLPNHFTVVRQPGLHTVRGIEIKGIQSYHDSEMGSRRGGNTIFVMTVDRMRVCHLGDLGHILHPSEVEDVGSVDVLMIPVGGFYTIGPEEADRVIERLQPKLSIPMHFKTEKVDFPISPVEVFTRGKPNVKMLDVSEIEISKEMLPDRPEVVVLKPAL